MKGVAVLLSEGDFENVFAALNVPWSGFGGVPDDSPPAAAVCLLEISCCASISKPSAADSMKDGCCMKTCVLTKAALEGGRVTARSPPYPVFKACE